MKTIRCSILNLFALAIVTSFSLGLSANGATAQETINVVQNEVAAEEAPSWVRELGRAIQVSKDTGRPIMLAFSGSDWCVWCQRLDQEVFRTEQFDEWSRKSVIKVMVDFPQSHRLPNDIAAQNEYLKKQFAAYVKGFPTVLFIKYDGAVIGKTGYVAGGPDAWIKAADSIVGKKSSREASKSKSPDSFKR